MAVFYSLAFEDATLAVEMTSCWWHLWRAETCRRYTEVWCVYVLAKVKLVI